MPWKYKNKVIVEGRSWSNDDGVKHPPNWNIWSDADKKSQGLVWEAPAPSFDDRFWENADTPRPLDQLKEIQKSETARQVYQKLQPTDYIYARKAEDDTYVIPESLLTYRKNVRSAAAKITALIDSASDHAAFVSLFEQDKNGVIPVYDWPEKE